MDQPYQLDTPRDGRVAQEAAQQAGVISTAQLHRLGLNKGAVQVRVRRGQLHPVHRGVYAVGHPAISLHGRFWAAVLACGSGALLSHFAAAVLWGLLKWDDRLIGVTVVGSGGRRRAGLRIHRTRALHPRDHDRQYGIRVTSPARTLLDLAGSDLSDKALRRAVRQAQSLHLTNVRQIAELLEHANGHRGVARLAALIADGPEATESMHEDVVLDLLLAAGFEHPVVNGTLVVAGKPYRPDLRWPAQRLILEIDSGWHDGRLAQEDDAVRQGDLEAVGERVLRTTRERAMRQPHQLVRRLVAAGAPYTDRR